MSKELKALNELKKRYGKNFSMQDDERTHIIENALKRLYKFEKVFEELNLDISDDVDLKNWIKLAQFHYENKNKKLKALEIIREKEIDVGEFLSCILLEKKDYIKDAFEEFNCHLLTHKQLTQEEYDLLKEVLL